MKTKLYSFFFVVMAVVMFSLVAVFPTQIANAQDKTAKGFVDDAKRMIGDYEKINLTPEQLKEKINGGDKIVLLDVREKDEYDKGHLVGAILIPRGLLEFRVVKELPNKNTPILVYCKVGGRSAIAIYTLKLMGYKNLLHLKGGSQAWQKLHLPMER